MTALAADPPVTTVTVMCSFRVRTAPTKARITDIHALSTRL
ncbi:hypothetical protein Ae706Ps2_0072 [Pseudonocardia sp. Ae706_Ps2]|nr:hypothetical protein Ae505Ps2_3761 [Pseudonocardia sp. Ae505_Ps2]OLM21640.1 hypothetical protein Ae706Ps2_0072 [Pseudonocardia sp. Ae706_Ps2]